MNDLERLKQHVDRLDTRVRQVERLLGVDECVAAGAPVADRLGALETSIEELAQRIPPAVVAVHAIDCDLDEDCTCGVVAEWGGGFAAPNAVGELDGVLAEVVSGETGAELPCTCVFVGNGVWKDDENCPRGMAVGNHYRREPAPAFAWFPATPPDPVDPCVVTPEPRYDEVFRAGTEWLNAGGSDTFEPVQPPEVPPRPNCDTSFSCPACGRKDELDLEVYNDCDGVEHTCAGCQADMYVHVHLTIRLTAELAEDGS
jgi:hypothetical protein